MNKVFASLIALGAFSAQAADKLLSLNCSQPVSNSVRHVVIAEVAELESGDGQIPLAFEPTLSFWVEADVLDDRGVPDSTMVFDKTELPLEKFDAEGRSLRFSATGGEAPGPITKYVLEARVKGIIEETVTAELKADGRAWLKDLTCTRVVRGE